ncbi:alpha/beta hydrolase [Parashewanella curva]|uniref:Alpha/beta hydrolase n=1 Tax=Parashewanella curva TaxID=2338552 RepID=A0A3L8Q0W0_9GAMM|nr:alpha/beta hydrolase [Parashewanella curva]RLV61271.1 alpha/beta hydrolase [Parashewanella curva]
MLFITNRTPKQSARSRKGRRISFDYQNTAVSQYLYFCQRHNTDEYTEILHHDFFQYLKSLPAHTQLLFYIHGFNNNMEPDVFENANKLQNLINQQSSQLVEVIPIIWPCDDDSALAFIDDYWDDQDAADASGPAFSRLLGKFEQWRREAEQQQHPCFKRMNVLAHSMGSRLLVNAIAGWASKYNANNMPLLFRNIFMVAADVDNQILESDKPGHHLSDSARNLCVYFARDDLAMPASKLANLRHKCLSRRMGMTGPNDLKQLPKNVYEIDCDNFNNKFDLKGHSYFLDNKHGVASPVIEHMIKAITTGRVSPPQSSHILEFIQPD